MTFRDDDDADVDAVFKLRKSGDNGVNDCDGEKAFGELAFIRNG